MFWKGAQMKHSHQFLLIYFSLESPPVADSSTAECFLCDSSVDIKFEPCGHAMMCSTCAQRAKRCPQCKVYRKMSSIIIIN